MAAYRARGSPGRVVMCAPVLKGAAKRGAFALITTDVDLDGWAVDGHRTSHPWGWVRP